MTALKTLAIAAALAATVTTPVMAGDNRGLGLVDVHLMDFPVACRALDNAIEASKLDTKAPVKIEYDPQLFPRGKYSYVAWVLRHQVGSTESPDFPHFRIPPKRDCRFGKDGYSNIFGQPELPLNGAIAVRYAAPGLPPGKIAVCVTNSYAMFPDSVRGCPDSAEGRLENGAFVFTYWIVAEPEWFMRNFDLPREGR
jgi:hypothetical protein